MTHSNTVLVNILTSCPSTSGAICEIKAGTGHHFTMENPGHRRGSTSGVKM